MTWNPALYLAYADQRLRPAAELLARIALDRPHSIIDLGCGPGNSTRLLRQRWPEAHILGVDNSPQMLARARTDGVNANWVEADLESWRPAQPADLIYSNAALQWLDGHARLLPDLIRNVAEGGALALQMPRNFNAPSHRLLREVARAGPWAAMLAPLVRDDPVADAETYYDLLKPHARTLDIWETTYLQVLEGEDPVLGWISGTTLLPLLGALDTPLRDAYLAALAERLRAAYPRRRDGATLFSFRRIFIIAYR